MKFTHGTRRKAAEYEKALLTYWRENKTFEKSVANRPADDAYVFYDGPPFITGAPHAGTLLTSIVKDAVPRYFTMKGKRVERRWGWDCHGLPAEVFTEKKLGITDRRDIGTKISLTDYITTCRDNMVTTGNLWEDTIDRIGRWVDFKGAYKTMDKEYMESVWWAFKQLYEKDKIYEGEKVLLYCTRDATPISKAEVAMDNSYQDVTDPSVYVKFGLINEKDENKKPGKYLLVWTTTPWTLSANTALAVGKDITYVEVEVQGQTLIVARDLLEKVLIDEKYQPLKYKLVDTFKGERLIGKEYVSLDISDDGVCSADQNEQGNYIWHGDFVNTDEGTGVVHIAPAFGEDDYVLAKKHDIGLVMTVNDEGEYLSGEWSGKLVWDVNKEIAKTLHKRGVIWKIDYIRHSYPHCHRCGTRLMYRAHPSWFMDIDGQRTQMLEQNAQVHWFPEHIKHGRSEKTIQTAPDWNLSRDRFWATAMPVWKAVDDNGQQHVKVVGSYAELQQLSGKTLDDYHRPWIDDITFEIDGLTYKRIDKVLDCWFESGSMPFAQFHYPFENVQKFEANYPGDFIVEYVPQVRAWFYYMNAVNVGIFGTVPFKTALVHGTLAGNDGRKMSKSFGNYTDPNELMNTYSADALRFLFLSSPLLNGEDFNLVDKDVADIQRKLAMIWNMYDFFTMYAEVDGWSFDSAQNETTKLPKDPSAELTNVLDIWIVSRLHQLTASIETCMQAYDIPNATKPVLEFLDDASNWYVRRSRRRFWKSDNDSDKNDAYRTLHYVLVQLATVLAPFTPFLSEELYQKLTGGESVHLLDWPNRGEIDEAVVAKMRFAREVINEGLSQRAIAKRKVRQPLTVAYVYDKIHLLDDDSKQIIKEELNVRELKVEHNLPFYVPSPDDAGNWVGEPKVCKIDISLTPELIREGTMREVVRAVQTARKQAELQVDDRIQLNLQTDDPDLQKAITEHSQTIMAETLAELSQKQLQHVQTVTIDGAQLIIGLQRLA